MEIKEGDRLAWFSKGKILASLGKLEAALDCFERAIALKNNYYEAWSEKGFVLEQLGRLEEADFCFNQSLGVFCEELSASLEDDLSILATPEDGTCGGFYNQACFHAIQGNLDLAITYLEKAIAVNPFKYSTMALQDVDFQSISNNIKFQQLTTLHLETISCPLK
jgi:tetratricopeptide (TPR) repeat protein